ncbi:MULTISPECIES: alpha/beta fold hydrolase [unclassified Lentimonas]|uniref:alpha/beta fold hydrolase n=1 Tax=unclassified Lentimonas TaxID=2630993 RepID=UPI001329CE42|nr:MULTISPECIES: alpha/beta fold hydrolase [unclassified Lentimonas]CAA6691169.1 Haloalkane dehalogenase-like protein [Lentimonas sp. CC19]CAA6694726.1 Haloalkane dehalogenase-like protein [Lentimonas sp. CC10]CAA7071550.1 Haloalkane dehalogenase-like protein [Lentimonas sp. CC11]
MIKSRASELPPEVRLEYPFAGNLFLQPETPSSDGPVRMHYLDEGTGPVVIMLHGNPTWSFYYRNVVKALTAAGYRCIVPDHVGCGLSDKPSDYPYTLKRRIEDVERLIDHLAIEQFSLIVHDWGGAIGCGVAGRRPEALEKLVLLNTGAFRSKRIPLRIASIKVPLIGEAIIRGLNGFAGPAAIMSVKVPLAPVVKTGMLWPYRNWADRVAVWNFVKDIPLREGHPSYETLTEVEAGLAKLADKPVQIVWGGKDFCFNMHFFKRWCEIFPNADVRLHEGHGHYILEDGGAAVLGQIEAFLVS